jgi:hypothetical protein
MKLKEWLPQECLDVHMGLHDMEIVSKFGYGELSRPWPGKQKNVYNWVLMSDGSAIGWNENPATGWTFPRIRRLKGKL